jgi:hypothetical protein
MGSMVAEFKIDWRKAIDDARLSLMLDITAPDANPAECVKELVSWANELALNPAISSDAQALIDRGLAMQAERHAEELLAYEVTMGNLREQAQPAPELGRFHQSLRISHDRQRSI